MTSYEVKQVVQSVERCFQKTVKATKEDPAGKIYKITLPFKDRHDQPFYLWAFQYPKSKKIQLSDGRRLVTDIQEAGSLKLQALQQLVNTYGLSLMEDLSIMDNSKRALGVRVSSFLQALVAIDGTLRMWATVQEKAA